MHGPFALHLQALLFLQDSNKNYRGNLSRNISGQTAHIKLLQMVQ